MLKTEQRGKDMRGCSCSFHKSLIFCVSGFMVSNEERLFPIFCYVYDLTLSETLKPQQLQFTR